MVSLDHPRLVHACVPLIHNQSCSAASMDSWPCTTSAAPAPPCPRLTLPSPAPPQTALRLKPFFTDAYNNMASALVQKGLIPQAMDCYMAALKINPNLVCGPATSHQPLQL
jgi:hypothetical protein